MARQELEQAAREAPLAPYGALKNILTRHADLLTSKIDPDGPPTTPMTTSLPM
jgi:hypothetical protein